jgi:hypothetical protein
VVAPASAVTIAARGEKAMAGKKRRRRTGSARTSGEKLIQILEKRKPEALETTVSEAEFGALVDRLLAASPSEEALHFYCRQCREYHLETHSHFEEMKQ